jgi:hypothetical protein
MLRKPVTHMNKKTPRKKAKPRGGARANAGRPQSRVTRETMQIRDRWVAEGHRTPLEVMLTNMEYYDVKVAELYAKTGLWLKPPKDDAERAERLKLLRTISGARNASQACAVDAAPFMHQKLNSLDLGKGDGRPFVIQLASGEELL